MTLCCMHQQKRLTHNTMEHNVLCCYLLFVLSILQQYGQQKSVFPSKQKIHTSNCISRSILISCDITIGKAASFCWFNSIVITTDNSKSTTKTSDAVYCYATIHNSPHRALSNKHCSYLLSQYTFTNYPGRDHSVIIGWGGVGK